MKILKFPHSPFVDDEPTEEQRELTATISCLDGELTDLTKQLVCRPALTAEHKSALIELNKKIMTFQLNASALLPQACGIPQISGE